MGRRERERPHFSGLELLDEMDLALVQPAEFVDLVLVFSAHFDFFAARCGFVFFGELGGDQPVSRRLSGKAGLTIRRCIVWDILFVVN
jgi:hypothetical protein